MFGVRAGVHNVTLPALRERVTPLPPKSACVFIQRKSDPRKYFNNARLGLPLSLFHAGCAKRNAPEEDHFGFDVTGNRHGKDYRRRGKSNECKQLSARPQAFDDGQDYPEAPGPS